MAAPKVIFYRKISYFLPSSAVVLELHDSGLLPFVLWDDTQQL